MNYVPYLLLRDSKYKDGYYPYIFCSSTLYRGLKDIGKLYNIDELKVYCSFGSYFYYLFEDKVDKEKIFEWQVKNGDVNFSIFFPVKFIREGLSQKELLGLLKKNYDNIKWYYKMIDKFKDGKRKFSLVSQCLSLDDAGLEIDMLYSLLDGFDMVSVICDDNDYWGFLSGVMKWYELLGGRVDKIGLHILNVSDFMLPVIVYLGSIWNNLSISGCSALNNGIAGKYDMSGFYSDYVYLNNSLGDVFSLCDCYCCKSAGSYKDSRFLCLFHNSYSILKRVRLLDFVLRNDSALFDRIIKRAGLENYIGFIDGCLAYGWSRAVKSFWWLSTYRNSLQPISSGRIFDCFGFFNKICESGCPMFKECRDISSIIFYKRGDKNED